MQCPRVFPRPVPVSRPFIDSTLYRISNFDMSACPPYHIRGIEWPSFCYLRFLSPESLVSRVTY